MVNTLKPSPGRAVHFENFGLQKEEKKEQIEKTRMSLSFPVWRQIRIENGK